jgi:hypothetical protein
VLHCLRRAGSVGYGNPLLESRMPQGIPGSGLRGHAASVAAESSGEAMTKPALRVERRAQLRPSPDILRDLAWDLLQALTPRADSGCLALISHAQRMLKGNK